MVHADYGVAEAGQQPLPERRGLTATHDMVRESGLGDGKGGERKGNFLQHRRSSKLRLKHSDPASA
jgi:hypothetical protein